MRKVFITSCYRWTYFQWFILGLFELDKKGIIDLSFEIPLSSKMLFWFSWKPINKIIRKIQRKVELDSYLLKGYLQIKLKGLYNKSGGFRILRIDMYPESWTHIYELGGTHGCYPVLYRWHPFCFCLNSFVIIVIYIFFNGF